MQIFRNIDEIDLFLSKIRAKKNNIGLVPTMGGIHKGHISLINKSNDNSCFTIATIFVNPTQFNNKNDYLNYPKNEKKDIAKLKTVGCQAIYIPRVDEAYPKGLIKKNKVTKYRNILCDKFRPGHFNGVTTIVEFLFRVIQPNYAYFGEKDYQQYKIIDNLNNKLKLGIKIQACPSVRLFNGLSLSTRYVNFLPQEKIIFNKCGNLIKILINKLKNNYSVNLKEFKSTFKKLGVKKIDYIEIRNEDTLMISDTCYKSRLFVAMYIGKIRIIDNFILY